MKTASLAIVVVSALALASRPGNAGAPAGRQEKQTTMKGTIFRGDKSHPVSKAQIILLDQSKSEKKNNSVQSAADENGKYAFEHVEPGTYTVSIMTFYATEDEVPCKLLAARTADKNSALVVMHEKDHFIEQVFIKDFKIKGGKETLKDFDIACKSLFEK